MLQGGLGIQDSNVLAVKQGMASGILSKPFTYSGSMKLLYFLLGNVVRIFSLNIASVCLCLCTLQGRGWAL